MSVMISTTQYSGPMDLLLQLIEKEKMDIFDIPIAKITSEYLRVMKLFQKEKTSEELADFLSMATTLMQIKSRMLLKRPDEEDAEDPREELALKILEYKKIKEAEKKLAERLIEGEKFHSKLQEDLSKFESEGQIIVEDAKILKNFLIRILIDEDTIEMEEKIIEPDEFPLQRYIFYLMDLFRSNERISLISLCSRRSKLEKIIIFLAVLELIKNGKIQCIQKKNDIFIKERRMNG